MSVATSAVGQTGFVPRRKLGKTDVEVSALWVGGFHLGAAKDQAEATEIVHQALDAGVIFDNCWEYHEGVSEERLGIALEGLRKNDVTMTKVCRMDETKRLRCECWKNRCAGCVRTTWMSGRFMKWSTGTTLT